MSIKTSADEWVRKGPSQALALAAVAGIIVGGIIGVGAGYKIEQNRTRSDVKRLHAQIKAAGGGSTGTTTTGTVGQRVGKVTASASGSITITTRQQGTEVLKTTGTTVFEQVVAGTIGDVQAGKHVLVTPGGREIIVLSASSKLGRPVSKVAGDSISLEKANGAPGGSIPTKDVKIVETLKTATAGAVKVNGEVLAGGKAATKGTFNTIEVIVLPPGSAFAG